MMAFVRYGLPGLLVVAGITIMLARGFDRAGIETAAALWGAAPALWMANWFYRISFDGDRERDHEAEARRFFAENGHWPDEPPPAPLPRRGRPRPPAT